VIWCCVLKLLLLSGHRAIWHVRRCSDAGEAGSIIYATYLLFLLPDQSKMTSVMRLHAHAGQPTAPTLAYYSPSHMPGTSQSVRQAPNGRRLVLSDRRKGCTRFGPYRRRHALFLLTPILCTFLPWCACVCTQCVLSLLCPECTSYAGRARHRQSFCTCELLLLRCHTCETVH